MNWSDKILNWLPAKSFNWVCEKKYRLARRIDDLAINLYRKLIKLAHWIKCL